MRSLHPYSIRTTLVKIKSRFLCSISGKNINKSPKKSPEKKRGKAIIASIEKNLPEKETKCKIKKEGAQ